MKLARCEILLPAGVHIPWCILTLGDYVVLGLKYVPEIDPQSLVFRL